MATEKMVLKTKVKKENTSLSVSQTGESAIVNAVSRTEKKDGNEPEFWMPTNERDKKRLIIVLAKMVNYYLDTHPEEFARTEKIPEPILIATKVGSKVMRGFCRALRDTTICASLAFPKEVNRLCLFVYTLANR